MPDYLPDEILARADFRDACARHDFGTMFLIIHEYRDQGWTFSHIGRRCEIANIRIYTRCGTYPESVHVIERVSDGLHIPGDMLRIGRRSWEETHDSDSRRSIVRLDFTKAQKPLEFDGIQSARPLRDQGTNEDIVDVLGRVQKLGRTVNPEVIHHLRDNLWHTVANYEKLDHSNLAPFLVKQRALADAILDECAHPKQRQQLFEIAGTASGLLGYVAVGRGDFPLARAYCLEAFQLSDFAQDSNLQAWSRGMQSFCEYYAGRYDEALSLARDGLVYAGSGPQSVRLTINGVARALGKLGDVEGVHCAVEKAYDLMSGNDVPDGVPSSITFDCYSAAQTASNAATAYVSLGLPEKVQHYIGLALPDISESNSLWSQSLVMIDLAVSLIHSKEEDLDRAAELVLDAINTSAGRPIFSIQARISEFVRDTIERWGDTRQINAIRDAVSIKGT